MLTEALSTKLKANLQPALVYEPRKLSEFLGFSILVASETLQHTGSFKFRAAYNVVLNSQAEHFVTISSGNFAQALAYATKIEKRRATILMPSQSAQVKIDAVKSFGAELILVDTNIKSRKEWIEEFCQNLSKTESNFEVLSPYNDERVIAGNSTLADDIINQTTPEQFNTVFVPVGGGGLSSGIVTGLKRNGCDAKVIGVEPQIANDAARSLKAGKLLFNQSEPDTIADGVRTLSLGDKNWAILKDGLDHIAEVEEESIEKAVKLYFEKANLKVEPSGALSLAAILASPKRYQDSKPLCIVSGGNVDQHLYAKLVTA